MGWPIDIDGWGSSEDERKAAYSCDALIDSPDRVLFRAVDVAAPADLGFRWVCQLRAAPYSYDWIDNLGRPSPRQLTPGLDQLEVGQRVATMFRLASFDPGRSITFDAHSWLFGRVAMTYRAVPSEPGAGPDAGPDAGVTAGSRRCRLVVKLLIAWPSGLHGPAMRALLPAGDLVMMRRQLLNLKALAEGDAAGAAAAVAVAAAAGAGAPGGETGW